jgi:hypothetical protein
MFGARIRHVVGVVVICSSSVVRAADISATLAQAQQAVDQGDTADAIALLERALPEAKGDNRILSLLRRSYRAEIPKRVQAGDRAGAQRYADRLRLIEDQETASDSGHRNTSETGAAVDNVKVLVPDGNGAAKVATGQSGWRRAQASKPDDAPTASSPPPNHGAGPLPSARVTSAHPTHVTPAPIDSRPQEPKTGSDASDRAAKLVKQADALFVAHRYIEAEPLYEKAQVTAPESIAAARDRWVYCRLATAVAHINATPSSRQWTDIQTELRSILTKVPDNTFAQSLLAMADTEVGSPSPTAGARETIVRASEPDRAESRETNILSDLAIRIGLGAGNSGQKSLWQRFRSGPWQVLETSNFRVHATDDQLAGQLADIAESTRIELFKTWYGQVPETNWSPKCDIYVHDSVDEYARITRQGPSSPGHSQTGVDRGKITNRRIDLRRNGTDLVHAILPHEITHVVLADRFSARPMPRWADEGMAVLTEPSEKKQAHLRNLGDYLKRGHVYSARQLMTMDDYPSGNQWPMFYAESVSLVDFLVNRGGPTKFIQFMESSLQNGYDAELKRVYGLAGMDELDRAWSGSRGGQIASATGSVVSR